VSSLENVGLEIFGLPVFVNGAEVVIEVYMGFLFAGFGCAGQGGKTTKAAGLVNPAASEEVI
jgi:hypothetical protein